MSDDYNLGDPEEWSNYIEYEDLLDISYLENIEYVHKSDDKLVVLDKKISKKVAITRDSIGNIEELMRLNANLKILNGQGYKNGDYIELILPQLPGSQYIYNLFVLDDVEFTFYIGEIEVSIKAATDMFILLTDIVNGYFTYTDKYTLTISLKGITEHNYADYYNQSLFMISMIPPNDHLLDNNKDECNIELNELINSHYKNKNYNEVFYFYNEAMRIYNREISSLYLYKILEYFFLIARKKEFEKIINDYNKDKAIDTFIKKITKLYKDEELEQLTILLNSIKEKLSNILYNAIKLSILDSCDINSFAKELYLYRNSIVHGKSDYKFDLKIPNTLCESEKDIFWKDSLKYITEVLLFKYCIQKID